MTTLVISQPSLFPWVGMLEQIALADVYVHYDDVQFVREWFTRRVQLKTADGPKWMSIPVTKSGLHTFIKDATIDNAKDWKSTHFAQFTNTYKKATHFGRADALLHQVYDNPTELVGELAMTSLELMAVQVGIDTKFERSSQLGIGGGQTERLINLCKHFDADTYVTGRGAANYMDHDQFETAGVEVRYMDYARTPYPQMNGEFTPYVTSLDLIANVGDDASSYVTPRTVSWREVVSG